MKKKKPNLLVLGASGGVANAFLHYLSGYRDNLFGKLVLLDKNSKVLKNCSIDHKVLNYRFLHKKIDLPKKSRYKVKNLRLQKEPGEKEYLDILKDNKIDIVLDITDANTLEILEATNKAGVSYINTAMNDDKKTTDELIFDIYPRKNKLKNAPHILCAGMNPGNVNMWARYGIEKFGTPKQIIHFEFDTSMVAKKWHSMTTWSIREFIVEAVKDPSGIALGRRKIKHLFPNALENRENMKSILEPIMKLKKYPEGITVLHEENVSMSYKYDIPSKFIYAIFPKTLENLIKIYEKKGKISKKDLILGDNIREALDGADNVGVLLDYPDKKVYYFNSIPNAAVIGTNSTYTQVVVGIFSAIFTLLVDKLNPGVYFTEDLFDAHYKYFMFDNMRVQESVFKKNKGNLKLVKYNPEIKLKRSKSDRFERFCII